MQPESSGLGVVSVKVPPELVVQSAYPLDLLVLLLDKVGDLIGFRDRLAEEFSHMHERTFIGIVAADGGVDVSPALPQ